MEVELFEMKNAQFTQKNQERGKFIRHFFCGKIFSQVGVKVRSLGGGFEFY